MTRCSWRVAVELSGSSQPGSLAVSVFTSNSQERSFNRTRRSNVELSGSSQLAALKSKKRCRSLLSGTHHCRIISGSLSVAADSLSCANTISSAGPWRTNHLRTGKKRGRPQQRMTRITQAPTDINRHHIVELRRPLWNPRALRRAFVGRSQPLVASHLSSLL